MDFVHLHVHTNYSILNGVCKVEYLANRLTAINQHAAAITDHSNMFGVVNFYDALKSRNIKPIIGCELYIASNSRFDRVAVDSVSHLVVLCENKFGYKNLVKIVTSSYIDSFYIVPRTDFEFLKKNKDGLIVLSGCSRGEISKALANNNYEKAKNIALKYKDVFGADNFFLELQNFKTEKDRIMVKYFLKLAKETNIKIVATNNVHYIYSKDRLAKEVLDCIKYSKIFKKEYIKKQFRAERYLKTGYEMAELFGGCEEALNNTVNIASRCEFCFEFGKINIPKFKCDENVSSEEYLKLKAKDGLFLKYAGRLNKEILKRFEYELSVVINMGFADYFLIVYDYVDYAKKNNIFVGPGRGSGAGSLLGFCLGITEVDPIKYNLSFERFLNVYRSKMPDFDIDFCNERRHEVIDYVIKKYGSNNVARIITFGTLAPKAAIRDVGRILGYSLEFIEKILKYIPNKPGISLGEVLNKSIKLKNAVTNNEDLNILFKLAVLVEGSLKNTSIHAAAIVITKEELRNFIPVLKSDGVIVTQYNMGNIEKLGLLKMDFLGLRNLTIMSRCEELIKKKCPEFKVLNIPFNDEKTFNMLSAGDSVGVFQLESYGMQNVLKKLSPCCLEDVMALLALNRPGPSQFIDVFINNRKNPNCIEFLHSKLKNILNSTYGVIVYQEQVIKIFIDIAGYSLKSVDIIRDAMSKKKLDVMQQERQFFIYGREDSEEYLCCCGALKNGLDEEVADKIFNYICKFALYAFNKAHAASYSIISYKTAYLKCNYFLEYIVSLLNSVLNNKEKLNLYIKECLKKNVVILPVDINRSEMLFKIEGNNAIRYAFLAVKHVSCGLCEHIILKRKGGKYISFEDFLYKLFEDSSCQEFNKNAILSLIKFGAFNEFAASRQYITENFDDILKTVKIKTKEIGGQLSLFQNVNSNVVEKKCKTVKLFGRVKNVLFNEKSENLGFLTINFACGGRVLNILANYKFFYKLLCNFKSGQDAMALVNFKNKDGNKYIFLNYIHKLESLNILFIKVTEINKEKLNFILKILKDNVGSSNVFFIKGLEKRCFINNNIKGVEITEGLINSLKEVAGRNNIYVKNININ